MPLVCIQCIPLAPHSILITTVKYYFKILRPPSRIRSSISDVLGFGARQILKFEVWLEPPLHDKH